MKNRISPEVSNEYKDLADKAREIESLLMGMALATSKAKIPDEAKIKIMDWIDRAETFRGLSYFLTPQTEWVGGDSSDARNFVNMNPHIAR